MRICYIQSFEFLICLFQKRDIIYVLEVRETGWAKGRLVYIDLLWNTVFSADYLAFIHS